MAAVHYPGTPGTILYGGRAAVAPGSDLTTLTLQNESASVQAAGFVSPMFGMPFKQGDMPAGSCPRFELADGTLCPATLWGVTSWPDGSMKFCGAMIRVPAAVPGSGTLAITVKSGGIAPGASARSTADLTSADLKVEATGITNLSGVWVASLNDAIADGSDIVVIGDGPAGKVWRIGGHFRQAGAPHGQLYCWHYVTALQDSSGGLLGLRYLGRAAQPFADVTSPTPTRRVLTAALKSSAATLRALQGHDSTETVGANIGMPHYTSFFTAGTDGRWDFVQGGGSALADCTVRVQHDKTYVVKSRLLPPMDTTKTATSGTSVDYVPYCIGAIENRNTGATGDWGYIGIIPKWQATHLLTQSAVDERIVRVTGLAGGGWVETVRRSTTKQIIPVHDIQPSYPGLGTIQTGWRRADSYITGFVAPVSNDSLWAVDTAHRPSAFYYPYLITGEPQYLDMLEEIAAASTAYSDPGLFVANTTTPMTNTAIGTYAGLRDLKVGSTGATYKGAGLMWSDGGTRHQAWCTRDIAHAAAILQDNSPSKPYLLDFMKSNHDAVNDFNSKMPQSWRDAGLNAVTSTRAFLTGGDTFYESPWMTMYLSLSLCNQSMILGTSESVTLRQHLAKFISSAHASSNLASLASYRWRQWDGNDELVLSAAGVLGNQQGTFTFDTATSRCTLSGVAWTPTNGDKFAFSSRLDSDKPFAEATDHRVFYAVNCSGNTFQLSLTPGGSPVTVTSNVVVSNLFAQIQDSILDVGGDAVYYQLLYAAARFHEACGDSVVSAARVVMDAKVAANGGADVKLSFAPSFHS